MRENVRLSCADHARDDIRDGLSDYRKAVIRARRSAGSGNRTTLVCLFQVVRVLAEKEQYDAACFLMGHLPLIS